jgi:hypothetical protein
MRWVWFESTGLVYRSVDPCPHPAPAAGVSDSSSRFPSHVGTDRRRRRAVIQERVSDPQRRIARVVAPRRGEVPNLGYGNQFRIQVREHGNDSVVVLLFGELDLTTTAEFERVVAGVLSCTPEKVIFDLTRSQFVSAQGYAVMGRCSSEVAVEVRSRTGLASRVLTVLGYELVDVVIARDPPLDAFD